MKGLASTTPSFATVRVSGRSARKHYGIGIEVDYDSKEHKASERLVTGSISESLLFLYITDLCRTYTGYGRLSRVHS